jgi:hypothetical protein
MKASKKKIKLTEGQKDWCREMTALGKKYDALKDKKRKTSEDRLAMRDLQRRMMIMIAPEARSGGRFYPVLIPTDIKDEYDAYYDLPVKKHSRTVKMKPGGASDLPKKLRQRIKI